MLIFNLLAFISFQLIYNKQILLLELENNQHYVLKMFDGRLHSAFIHWQVDLPAVESEESVYCAYGSSEFSLILCMTLFSLLFFPGK